LVDLERQPLGAMQLGRVDTYKNLAPYGGDRHAKGPTSFQKGPTSSHPDDSTTAMRVALQKMDKRLEKMNDALEAKADFYEDIKHGMQEMKEELQQIEVLAGQRKAKENVARISSAVLNLTDTFDSLDRNESGSIDVTELRRGLHTLGMDSHSAQASAIIERYTRDQTIDIKVFTTLVKDIHMLLTFDRDGSGTLDVDELKEALVQLGMNVSDRNVAKIARAWDADGSGKLDLLEFTDLVRTLQTFMKYDKDGSGDIDLEEIRPALRRLGIPAETKMTNAILNWYDNDESGKIELHEFAVLVRDASVFASYDKDHSGALDIHELRPALAKLGLAASEEEVRQIIKAWDDNGNGTINLLEFAEIVRDLQVFEQFDLDRSGSITAAELRVALGKLGKNVSHHGAQDLLNQYDLDSSGTIEFSEFRKLAEDLPSLVERKSDSFFREHGQERAYVHWEDVLDEDMHIDLDQSFVKGAKSMKKKSGQSVGALKMQSGSVLGAASTAPTSVLGGASILSGASVLGGGGVAGPEVGSAVKRDAVAAALRTATSPSNAFDSRLFSARPGSLAKRDSLRDVRPTRLLNSTAEPTLHISKKIMMD
jgi:calmodulin